MKKWLLILIILFIAIFTFMIIAMTTGLGKDLFDPIGNLFNFGSVPRPPNLPD